MKKLLLMLAVLVLPLSAFAQVQADSISAIVDKEARTQALQRTSVSDLKKLAANAPAASQSYMQDLIEGWHKYTTEVSKFSYSQHGCVFMAMLDLRDTYLALRAQDSQLAVRVAPIINQRVPFEVGGWSVTDYIEAQSDNIGGGWPASRNPERRDFEDFAQKVALDLATYEEVVQWVHQAEEMDNELNALQEKYKGVKGVGGLAGEIFYFRNWARTQEYTYHAKQSFGFSAERIMKKHLEVKAANPEAAVAFCQAVAAPIHNMQSGHNISITEQLRAFDVELGISGGAAPGESMDADEYIHWVHANAK